MSGMLEVGEIANELSSTATCVIVSTPDWLDSRQVCGINEETVASPEVLEHDEAGLGYINIVVLSSRELDNIDDGMSLFSLCSILDTSTATVLENVEFSVYGIDMRELPCKLAIDAVLRSKVPSVSEVIVCPVLSITALLIRLKERS